MRISKKEQIDQKAKELFWKYGFKKVTINEICEKANVSRKTFYTFYENKTALVTSVFNHAMDDAFQIYEQIMADNTSFSDKINRMFSYKYEMSGQISMDFIADFYHPESSELLDLFNNVIERSMALMRAFLAEAQKKGEMNPDLSLDYVMWLIQKWVDMSGTEELMLMFPDVETMTRQVSQSLIYGLMPVTKTTDGRTQG